MPQIVSNQTRKAEMKHAVYLTLFIVFIFMQNTANAEGIVEIDLVDGTIVSGQLISFDNGVYTVNSATLGTLKIRENNVKSIRSETSAKEKSPEISTQTGIQALQQRMVGDEEIMMMITSLLQDPDFQEILQDEALMKAISSGDLNTLKSNPKFQKLLNKSTIEQIQKRLEQ